MFRYGLASLAWVVVLGAVVLATTVGCSTQNPAAAQYSEMKGLKYVPPPTDYIQKQMKLKEASDANNAASNGAASQKGNASPLHP